MFASNEIPYINPPEYTIGEFVGFNNYVYFGYVFGIGIIGYKNCRFYWYYEILPVSSICNKSYKKKFLQEKELNEILPARKLIIEKNNYTYKVGEIIRDTDKHTRIISDIGLHWEIEFKTLIDKKKPLPALLSYRYKKWNCNYQALNDDSAILRTPWGEYYYSDHKARAIA